MNGLGIAEIKFSEVLEHKLKRLEAEFYIATSHSKHKFVLGEDAIEFVQYGTSEELNEEARGYPVLRLNEFESIFIKEPSKYCDKISQTTYENLMLKAGDVLVCRTNGNPKLVGKSAIVPRDTNFAFASYVFRVRPKREIINSECLTVYLNSKVGRAEIEKYSMVSNQANFSPAKFKEIQIPVLDFEFQKRIKELVKAAHEKLEQSKALYAEAESLLLEELGLRDFEPSNENVAVKSFKESFLTSGRLDAEFNEPRHEELEKILTAKGAVPLGSLIREDIQRGIQPKFVEGGGVFVIASKAVRPHGVILDKNECTNREFYESKEILKGKLQKGDVLLNGTGRGTLGRASIYNHNFPAIADNHVTIIRANEELCTPYYLMLYLNSIVGQMQSEKHQCGTSGQLELYPFQIKQFLIYLPESNDVQITILNLIENSFAARDESKRLLDTAKRAVELAIEQDEQAAMRLIEE